MLKRALLILFLLLLVALPVYAQEAEPTTAPDTTSAEAPVEETVTEDVHATEAVAEPAAEAEEETPSGVGQAFILLGLAAVFYMGYSYTMRKRSN